MKQGIFIAIMPRDGKNNRILKGIIPSSKLNLQREGGKTEEFALFSMCCIGRSHYVSYSRSLSPPQQPLSHHNNNNNGIDSSGSRNSNLIELDPYRFDNNNNESMTNSQPNSTSPTSPHDVGASGWYFFDSMADRVNEQNVPILTPAEELFLCFEREDIVAHLLQQQGGRGKPLPHLQRVLEDVSICFYKSMA